MKEFLKKLSDQDTRVKKEFLARLRDKFLKQLSPKARIFTEYAQRRIYSRDLAAIPVFLEKMLFRTTPLIVVQPAEIGDLEKILAIAGEELLPVFPRGIASWGLGGAVPTVNGIVVDFAPLDKIYPPDTEKLTITVEAGAKWGNIDEKLESYGLSLPVSPSSRFSTVGGWVATGGYGLNSLSFGHLSHWVTEIKVVTPEKGILSLTPQDQDFVAFFNTEGQLGLIYQVTLKLIPRLKKEYPHLIYFDSPEVAFKFARELLELQLIPLHLNFKGENLIREVNQVWEKKLLEEKDALLLAFADEEKEAEFKKRFPALKEAPAHLARLLWLERYRPLKRRHFAPSLLASEVILSLEAAPRFIKKALKLGENFKVPLFFEFHLIKTSKNYRVLAMSLFNCDRRKTMQYYAYLALVPALTRLGVKLGGKPYGIGIWNVPFFSTGFYEETRQKILSAKQKYDPSRIMNPRKFTSIQTRFFNLPAKLFHPIIFTGSMDFLLAVSPVLKIFLPPLKLGQAKESSLLESSAFSCTGCGNCLSVCPAYLTTRRESSSPRGKLSLSRRLLKGKSLALALAKDAFLCTRCGNCEEVCQSGIPHLAVWEELEEKLLKLFFLPKEEIRQFIDKLSQNPEYLELIGTKKWENL